MLLLLLACRITEAMKDDAYDPDGDGYVEDDDCNEDDATIHTGAEEVWYDGVDQDCSGGSDYDQDGDGFASATVPNAEGAVGTDCDDLDADVNLSAVEVWYDGVDQDCDSADDFDQDGDGFQSADHEPADGAVGTDCDDAQPTVYPGAEEVCNTGLDEDCSGDDNGCSLAGVVNVADADRTFTGEADTLFGRALGSGDWNNDGHMDLAIGATRAVNSGSLVDAGRVYVVYGPLTSDVTVDPAKDVLFEGVDALDYLGGAVDGSGDFDGDGTVDLIMGAHRYSEGGLNNNGAVAVRYGGATWSGASAMSATDVQFYGEWHSVGLGQVARFIGDVNGDGFDDIAMGASRASDGGSVYIIRGGSGYRGAINASDVEDKLILNGEEGDLLGEGRTIGGAFDLNGDGLYDIAFGGMYSSEVYDYGGLVYLLYGSETLPSGTRLYASATTSARLRPEAADDNLGGAIETPGDVNGDGNDDLLIGARNIENGYGSPLSDGKVYLILGDSTDYADDLDIASLATMTVTGVVSKDALGWMIDGGDINNDGTADLIVGAPGHDHDGVQDSGAVFVYPGSLSGNVTPADAEVVFSGPNLGDGAGMGNSATVFDANGDGVMDVFIGASEASMVYGYLGGGL